MVKRGRKTKFLRELFPVYTNQKHPRISGAIGFYPVMRFDCNMIQLPGVIQWVSY